MRHTIDKEASNLPFERFWALRLRRRQRLKAIEERRLIIFTDMSFGGENSRDEPFICITIEISHPPKERGSSRGCFYKKS